MIEVIVLLAVLGATIVAGLVLRVRAGRVRVAAPARRPHAGGWALAGLDPTGHRLLLLQLSSPVCAPCRRTAELLADLTAHTPGVVHHEVDVATSPEVARKLDVLRTPTVVGFDRGGAEVLRVSGVPRIADLEEALRGV
ncbi:MAG TPA: thioredoxin family protein [Pseudonocardia sp.]|nr:thioredoxin family protein [Pseudonocardia sp.]